ncbi:MAG: hypothetical protein NHG36_01890, partial [Chromatiaceae bacterium]|nr:hypothetical protein [Candidatus Thioaporhodococcus sediminis]
MTTETGIVYRHGDQDHPDQGHQSDQAQPPDQGHQSDQGQLPDQGHYPAGSHSSGDPQVGTALSPQALISRQAELVAGLLAILPAAQVLHETED